MPRLPQLLACVAVLGLTAVARPQITVPTLLKDVNPTASAVQADSELSPRPLALTRVGSAVYFYAYEPVHGYELWKTDGTPQGTALVKDINPGPAGSELTIYNEAIDSSWHRRTNGLDNTKPFPFQQLFPMPDGTVYFFAHRPTTGAELWKSDGTEAGTVMVKDIWPGAKSSTLGTLMVDYRREPVLSMTALGNKLYFTANDGPEGPGLWESDGTAEGTRLAVRVNVGGRVFTGPRCLAAAAGKVFFAGNDGPHGYEPWLYDPASRTARLLVDLTPRLNPPSSWDHLNDSNGMPLVHPPVVHGDKLYFFGRLIENDLHGLHMFVLHADGVIDIAAGAEEIGTGGRVLQTFQPIVMGGKIYYAGTTQSGSFLYAHDPSGELPNSTLIHPSTQYGHRYLGAAVPTGNGLVFAAETYEAGWELWSATATPGSAALVRDLNPGGYPGLATDSGRLDKARSFPLSYYSYGLPVFWSGSAAYFAATTSPANLQTAGNGASYNGQANLELYRSDLTHAGTGLFKEIVPGTAQSFPRDFVDAGNGRFVFTASDAAGGRQLWVSDGTAAGTVRLTDFAGGGSTPLSFTEVPSTGVFFSAAASQGRELWKTDGTTAGTTLVANIEPGAGSSRPVYLTAATGRLYFGARTTTGGVEIYSSDGTTAGTAMVRDVYPGPSDGLALTDGSGNVAPGSGLVVLNERLYFPGDAGTSGRELYVTDGTTAGTKRVRDIYLGSLSSLGWTNTDYSANDHTTLVPPPPFVKAGGYVYFAAYDPQAAALCDTYNYGIPWNREGDPLYYGGGGELWRTDGTAAGTVLAANINSRTELEGLQNVLGANARLLTPIENAHLPAGSLLLYANDSWQRAVWFNLPVGGHGDELWRYDAATRTASLVMDINPTPPDDIPGAGGSFVDRPMTVLDGVAYFAADDGTSGPEPWRTDGTPAGTFRLGDLGPDRLGSDPGPFVALGNRIVFRAADTMDGRSRLYVTDGSTAGTLRLSDAVFAAQGLPDAPAIAAWNGRVYFAGYSAADGKGIELYSTDGTPGSVRLEGDLNPGPGDSAPRGLTATGPGLIFSATDGVRGLEPWIIRGGAPACAADFNGVNGADLLDIFAFLTAWFAVDSAADFNRQDGVDLLDIFGFLTAWFAGCP